MKPKENVTLPDPLNYDNNYSNSRESNLTMSPHISEDLPEDSPCATAAAFLQACMPKSLGEPRPYLQRQMVPTNNTLTSTSYDCMEGLESSFTSMSMNETKGNKTESTSGFSDTDCPFDDFVSVLSTESASEPTRHSNPQLQVFRSEPSNLDNNFHPWTDFPVSSMDMVFNNNNNNNVDDDNDFLDENFLDYLDEIIDDLPKQQETVYYNDNDGKEDDFVNNSYHSCTANMGFDNNGNSAQGDHIYDENLYSNKRPKLNSMTSSSNTNVIEVELQSFITNSNSKEVFQRYLR